MGESDDTTINVGKDVRPESTMGFVAKHVFISPPTG